MTFVPDGEPTLDENLSEARHIVSARYTDGHYHQRLADRQGGRPEDLAGFDLVSLKVDSVLPGTWLRSTARTPHWTWKPSWRSLRFARDFEGILLTETCRTGLKRHRGKPQRHGGAYRQAESPLCLCLDTHQATRAEVGEAPRAAIAPEGLQYLLGACGASGTAHGVRGQRLRFNG